MNEHDWVVIGTGLGIMIPSLLGFASLIWYNVTINGRVSVLEAFEQRMPHDVGERLATLEASWAIVSSKMIKLMHSPHTPEIDALVEKFQRDEKSMTSTDWMNLLQLSSLVEKDVQAQKAARAIACFCVVECRKRLSLPMEPFHTHEETTIV